MVRQDDPRGNRMVMVFVRRQPVDVRESAGPDP